jgi:hypothetical protein
MLMMMMMKEGYMLSEDSIWRFPRQLGRRFMI